MKYIVFFESTILGKGIGKAGVNTHQVNRLTPQRESLHGEPLELKIEDCKLELGSNIGHGLFVGWVDHPDIFVGFLRLRRTNLPASHFCAISETQQNGRS